MSLSNTPQQPIIPAELGTLFHRAIDPLGAGRAALSTALERAAPDQVRRGYGAFFDQIRNTPLRSDEQCNNLLTLTHQISTLLPDKGEYLLRSLCFRAREDGLQLSLRESLCALARLLHQRDFSDSSEIFTITTEALNIPPNGSHQHRLTTIQLLLTRARTHLAELEPKEAETDLAVIGNELAAWTHHRVLLRDPLPHEESEFKLIIEVMLAQAETAAELGDSESASDILEDLNGTLKGITVYPQTSSWIDEARVYTLTQLAEIYYHWACRIEDTGDGSADSDAQLQQGKRVLIEAQEVLSRHEPDWLPPIAYAEIKILESELLLQLLDTPGTERALELATDLLKNISPSEPGVVELLDRLEECRENLNEIGKEDHEE